MAASKKSNIVADSKIAKKKKVLSKYFAFPRDFLKQ